MVIFSTMGPSCLCLNVTYGKSAGLVIERLPVRIPAGAAGNFLVQS